MSDSSPGPAGVPPSSPGRALAAARQARGMTVTEVALRLKFSPRKIEALEAERYDALPGPTFVRGMIRGYAKVLGIDADPLIEALGQHLAAGPATMRPRNMGVPFPRQPRHGSLIYALLAAVLLITVTSVIVEWSLRPSEPPAAVVRPAERPPAPQPAPPPVAPPVDVPPAAVEVAEPKPVEARRETVLAGKRIELVFDRESWVEITDAKGRVVFSQLNPPGTQTKVQGAAPFSLVIGNATGVKLRYNDRDVDLAPFTRADVARLKLD